jgi:hypothetical protein
MKKKIALIVILLLLSIVLNVKSFWPTFSNGGWLSEYLVNTSQEKVDLLDLLRLNSASSQKTIGSFCENEDDTFKKVKLIASNGKDIPAPNAISLKYDSFNSQIITSRFFENLPWPFT